VKKSTPIPDWNALVTRYCTRDFIPQDPVSFPHAYRHSDDWRDAECVALLAALFSYGRRDKIRETLTGILTKLGEHPARELSQLAPTQLKRRYRGFYYRFNTEHDLVFLLARLGEIYREGGSLRDLWIPLHRESGDIRLSIHGFRQQFLCGEDIPTPDTYGMKFLMADPMQNSAAKRFNMFLRWMVRADDVDLGLWADDVTRPAELMMPLDTHVATMARRYRITRRQSNDWKTVEEITNFFRRLCPEDPVRYDFALFGLGLHEARQGAAG
jgi:uncharacterized protein (TIGR02757 family)